MEYKSGLNGLLPTKAAAAYLGVPVRRFQRLAHTKNKKLRIPFYKIVKRHYYKPTDLDNWLEAQRG